MTIPKKNTTRKIVKHIRGKAHGPIMRLMSPSDIWRDTAFGRHERQQNYSGD